MEIEKLVPGVDYPRTFEEMDEWFRSEAGCRDYIRLARRVRLWALRGCRGALGGCARRISVQGLRYGNVVDRRYGVSGHPHAAAHVVPCDVIHNQSEEWCQRLWLAAGAGLGQLRNGLNVDAQAAQSDGTTGP